MDVGFHYLTQQAFGYWYAQPLFVLVNLGVFDLLHDKPRPAADVVAALGLHPDAGTRLLRAGVALKLLRREGDVLSNTDVATRFLVGESRETLVHWVRVMGRWLAPWAQLESAVRAGAAIEPATARLVDDADYRTDFVLGMHEYALRVCHAFARAVTPLMEGRRTLVDVGGGAGTYAIALCEAHPELRATILDFGDVLAVARQVIGRSAAAARIDTRPADYRADDLGREADVVLMSNVLHQEAPEVCRDMLARAHAALGPRGCLVVQSLFLGEDRVFPTFAALHNLSALLLWNGGCSYTASEVCRFVEDAGFVDVTVRTMPDNAESLIVAHKGQGSSTR